MARSASCHPPSFCVSAPDLHVFYPALQIFRFCIIACEDYTCLSQPHLNVSHTFCRTPSAPLPGCEPPTSPICRFLVVHHLTAPAVYYPHSQQQINTYTCFRLTGSVTNICIVHRAVTLSHVQGVRVRVQNFLSSIVLL